MSVSKAKERVQRFRKARRARGDRELNVWVHEALGLEIEQAVASGRFQSRQDAVHQALAAYFIRKEGEAVT